MLRGDFLPSPPRIVCMSLFKYCKGFLLKKVIKKKQNILTSTSSARWQYTIHLLYTFLLSLGIPCWSSARTINLPQKANSTIKKTNKRRKAWTDNKVSHILACERFRVRPLQIQDHKRISSNNINNNNNNNNNKKKNHETAKTKQPQSILPN